MTQKEFETRVRIEVSSKEFDSINDVYMNCDLDKDEFCKMWVKMNAKRVKRILAEQKEKERLEALREKAYSIFEEIKSMSNHSDTMFRLAVNVLTDKEREFIESLGINMEGHNSYGIRYFKPICDITFELGKFARVYA